MDEEITIIKKEESSRTSYFGKVEVELIEEGRVVRKYTTNVGTNHLFTYLCRCLAGGVNPAYDNLINERPGSINLLTADRRQVLSYNIRATSAVVSDEVPPGLEEQGQPGYTTNEATVIFEFLVPGLAIVNKSVQVVQLVSLAGRYMTDLNAPTIFAEAKFDGPIEIGGSNMNTNLYIRWTLTIRNSNENY